MNKKEFMAFLKSAEVKPGGSITVVVDFESGFKFESIKSKSSKTEMDGGAKKRVTKKPTKKPTKKRTATKK